MREATKSSMVKGDQVNQFKKILTAARISFRETFRASGIFISQLWGGGYKALLVGLVWLSLTSNLIFDLAELLIQTALYLSEEGSRGLLSSLGLYAIGGRIGAVGLFLILVTTLALLSRTFTLWLGAGYGFAIAINLDSFILDSIMSQDPLQPFGASDSDTLSFLSIFLPVLFFATFSVAIIEVVLTSQAFNSYVQSLSPAITNLKISEIIIWSLLLVFSATSIISWVVLFLTNETPVFWTYPVVGRLLAVILCVVVALLSVFSRGLLLTFSIFVVVVELVRVDQLLIAVFNQVDRLSEVPSELSGILEFRLLSLQLLSLGLIWVAIRSIADGVRKRTRARVDEWVDSRRHAIFGAEDQDPASAKRISVLAVLALVVSVPLPLAGLVLAYAARNDFVAANPRKSGLELAIGATIISWFGIGLQGLALALILWAGVLDIGVFDLIGDLLTELISLN